MKTYEFLELVHREYEPRSYLEIGVNTGASLALSRTRTIGVDPAFAVEAEIRCDVQLVKATSDDFFAREDALAHFPSGRVELAFVDGLHLVEYVLRDFVNVERHADWTSVILVDDVFPRYAARASRERGTLTGWTGDVLKLTEVLERYRPDLLSIALDTYPTGLLLVLGADPEDGTLERNYDEIVAEYVSPDPQSVPEPVLRCDGALEPASIAHSALWETLRQARESGEPREVGWEGVRRCVDAAGRPTERRRPTPRNAKAGGAATGKSAAIASPQSLPGRTVAAVRHRLRPVRRLS